MNGKIIVFLFLVINLFAVNTEVDKRNVIEGDNVVYSIIAKGNNIEFPKIDKICGVDVEGISNSQSISIINSKTDKTLTRSYVFTPIKSCEIKSYDVKVDNQIQKTKPITIKVLKDTKFSKDFKLEVNGSKRAIKGYPNIITIKFYQKTNVKVSSINLIFNQGNFELKKLSLKNYYQGIYEVSELKYMLIPKKAGKINLITKIKLGFEVQQRDIMGFVVNSMKYKTLQKKLTISVDKVNSDFVGDFNISLNVDKTKVKANQPINATLLIQGQGQLNNLSELKLDIPNITVYDNKAKINTFIKNQTLYTKYEKKYVLLADDNFTISPISFSFYDIHSHKMKTIQTKPIFIEVKNPSKPIIMNNQLKPKEIIKTKIEYKTNYLYMFIAFFIGIFIGVVIGIFVKKFDKFKLPQNLYTKLLPYADNKKVKIILEKLYNKEKLNKDDKAFLKEFLKDKR